MASIAWPGTVPDKPLVDSFTEQPERDIVRSSVSAGPAKARRRTTAGVRRWSMQIRMTETELGNLDTFYVDTTAQGALRFDFTHPREGTLVEARFVRRPVYRLVTEDDYDVQIQLEVLP